MNFLQKALLTLLITGAGYIYGHRCMAQTPGPGASEWSDSCVNNSFTASIQNTSQYSFSGFRRIHQYVDGDYIAVGSIRPNLAGDSYYKVYGMVMRISATGQMKWVKFAGLKDAAYESDTRFNASTITKGNLIIVASMRHIFCFDGNGNKVWQREHVVYVDQPIIEQIQETSDGGFILSSVHSSTGVVMKLNATGEQQWGRRMTLNSYLNARCVVETPSGFYTTGYSYNNWSSTGYSENILAKLDKQTGALLWAKSFLKASSAQGQAEFAFDWMEYANGELVLSGSTSTNYRGTNQTAQAIVRLNEEGQLISAQRITNPQSGAFLASLFRSKLFDPYARIGVIPGQTFMNNVQNDLYAYKLNSAGQPEWSWHYPNAGQETVDDITVTPAGALVMAGRHVTYPGGGNVVEQAMLMQTSPGGTIGTCNAVANNTVVTDLAVPIEPVSLNGGTFKYDIAPNADFPVFDGSGFSWDITCGQLRTCRLGRINGPSIVCTGTANTYQIKKDGGCTDRVVFSSNSPLVTISQASDDKATITCNSAATVTIYATLNTTCGLLTDSLVIEATNLPAKVNLGADVALCPNNTIVLNAKKGYASYLWDNGSTDSLRSVTAPGKYSVTVKDGCGNISTDDIIVTTETNLGYTPATDRQKCNNDTLHLNAPNGFINYNWRTAGNSFSQSMQHVVVNPVIDTKYMLTAQKRPDCFIYDTIEVKVLYSPDIRLGNDTSLCEGTSLPLHAGASFRGYLWSTGATTPSITVNAAGRYSVLATYTNDCISRDTLIIEAILAKPVAGLGSDNTICTGASKVLKARDGYTSYLWSDGSTGTATTISSLGNYWVKVTDQHGCEATETRSINRWLPLPSGFLPKDTSMCSYGTIVIRPVTRFRQYAWSDASVAASLTVTTPGIYWLQATDEHECVGKDTVVVGLRKCIEGFYAPTAFTPNQDGRNDYFKPLVFGRIAKYALTIYNRWGQVVHQTSEYDGKGWNGLFKGEIQPPGAFVWLCRYQLEGQPLQEEKGTVLLMR
ncbi:T9SS type B sorting domain-containing protein [Filimonas effusa]|uniref:Gliding motility-associated C-terminal domain-containing protein n=1 Tax=Filimonas effusa TaxID=2508721 RepID=A0A4Q1DAS3_9BACT|nr:gliding motility-associated C-terminal domain-containing protein [Filimonas effusa]RXK86008.1 gliding motility-associated C-terminal domain-containing protein [Filimonas effusa]